VGGLPQGGKLKYDMKHALILAILLAASGCASKRPLPPTVIEKVRTVTETIRDTVFVVEPEKSTATFEVNCPDQQQPTIKPTGSKPAKNLKPPTADLSGNVLTVDCQTLAQDMFFRWKEQFVLETQNNKEFVNVPFEPSWFQKLYMAVGKVTLLVIIIGLGLRFSPLNINVLKFLK
jgi:hypothetical protein